MTLKRKTDNDEMQSQLPPAAQHILNWAKLRPDQPFCFRDFIDKYRHGTIRNEFSRLKKLKLIKLAYRSFIAFYVLASSKVKSISDPMTLTHMGGRYDVRRIKIDLGSLLDSLEWEDVCRVHNINLNFNVDGLYEYYIRQMKYPVNKASKDIKIPKIEWSRGRTLNAVLHHNGKVTAYLKCSRLPIEVSIKGLVSLASFLGGVRKSLANSRFDENKIPNVENWLVVQWHYGRDGLRELSGPALNVTFDTLCNELARIYLKNQNQSLMGRLEVLEQPRKKLPEAFEERISPKS